MKISVTIFADVANLHNEIQWKVLILINGKSMENQWKINGKAMEKQWKRQWKKECKVADARAACRRSPGADVANLHKFNGKSMEN